MLAWPERRRRGLLIRSSFLLCAALVLRQKTLDKRSIHASGTEIGISQDSPVQRDGRENPFHDEHLEGTRFSIGEPDGSKTERCQGIAAALVRAGLKCPIRTRIRNTSSA